MKIFCDDISIHVPAFVLRWMQTYCLIFTSTAALFMSTRGVVVINVFIIEPPFRRVNLFFRWRDDDFHHCPPIIVVTFLQCFVSSLVLVMTQRSIFLLNSLPPRRFTAHTSILHVPYLQELITSIFGAIVLTALQFSILETTPVFICNSDNF